MTGDSKLFSVTKFDKRVVLNVTAHYERRQYESSKKQSGSRPKGEVGTSIALPFPPGRREAFGSCYDAAFRHWLCHSLIHLNPSRVLQQLPVAIVIWIERTPAIVPLLVFLATLIAVERLLSLRLQSRKRRWLYRTPLGPLFQVEAKVLSRDSRVLAMSPHFTNFWLY